MLYESADRRSLQQIKETLTGGSLSIKFFSPFTSVEKPDREHAATSLDASPSALLARKRILDTKVGEWKELEKYRTHIRSWWQEKTLPYVFDGTRLMLRKDRDEIFKKVEGFNADLGELSRRLDAARQDLIAQARADLGRMFRMSDYPDTFVGEFSCELRERSIEPPSYLAHSNAEEYQRELERSVQDIQRSMQRFEAEQFARLSELTQRLSQNMDGQRVMSSNVEGFGKLFSHVAAFNFEGTRIFQSAMAEAKEIIAGVDVEDLRRDKGLRAEVKAQLERFKAEHLERVEVVKQITQADALSA